MWPHLLTIAVGGTAVGIGTDDDALAALLAPWRIAPDQLQGVADRVDFGAELHPPEPTQRAAPRAVPRAVPTVHHGSQVIARSTDPAALRDGLLRTLGALAVDTPAGHLRLTGLPLMRDGGIELAVPEAVDRVAHRRLLGQGYTPVYVPSVLIHPGTLQVRIAAPFGTGQEPVVAPLRRWWMAAPPTGVAPPVGLARVVAHATHRLAPPQHFDELSSQPGGDALSALVQLVEQLPPVLGGPGS